MELRSYQSEAIDKLHAAFDTSRSVCLTMPTGSGKTVVFAEIARLCAEFGTSVAILVHRDNLLTQTADKLNAIGVPFSFVSPGKTHFGDKVSVCSIQTLVRRMGKYSFDFLVIDEAHHSTSPSYRKVIDAWPDCRVLGVTATPSRLDGRGLGEVFEKLVTGPSIQELIDDGFLTSAVSYGSEMVANMANVRTTAGDYNIHDLEEALDKSEITGSAVEHYASLCPGAPAIAFCTTVRHSHDVAKQFSDAGYRAFPIDGKMPMSLIRDRINGLRDGSVQILTSCELVSEGLDVVGATAAILLRPTKSKALFLQQCGRVLRPLYPKSMPTNTREQRLAAIASSYKPKAIILDHSQNVWRHGLPEEVQEWSLDARKKKPSTTIGVRSCPQCFAYCPIGRKSCLKCGFVFTVVPTDREIPQVAGQLTKLDAAMMSRFRRKEEGLCRTYEDLRALGERRGYNIKWAYRRALERGFIK